MGGFKPKKMKPKWLSYSYLPEVPGHIKSNTLFDNLRNLMWVCHCKIFTRYGGLSLRSRVLHLEYPFIHPCPLHQMKNFQNNFNGFVGIYSIVMIKPLSSQQQRCLLSLAKLSKEKKGTNILANYFIGLSH